MDYPILILKIYVTKLQILQGNPKPSQSLTTLEGSETNS